MCESMLCIDALIKILIKAYARLHRTSPLLHLLEQLACNVGQASSATGTTALVLEEQLERDLSRLADDTLLSSALLQLSLALLVVKELAGLSERERQEPALGLVRALLAVTAAAAALAVEELKRLHGRSGTEALLVGLFAAVLAVDELLVVVDSGSLVNVTPAVAALADGSEDAGEEVLVT
jgi:hypothetical protein